MQGRECNSGSIHSTRCQVIPHKDCADEVRVLVWIHGGTNDLLLEWMVGLGQTKPGWLYLSWEDDVDQIKLDLVKESHVLQ